MEANEINISDWERILIGEVPLVFYIESFFRALIIFLLVILTMKLIGKKMVSQLGQSEMIATVALAAVAGVPLMSPDRGLLPAFIVAIIVILFQKGLTAGIKASERFERITQNDISTLVKDGVCCLEVMKKSRITPERLRAQLRAEGIRHLGQVKRMYLEANGSFSLLYNKEKEVGLCILPEWDSEFREKVCKSADAVVCTNCGTSLDHTSQKKCINCGGKEFENAVI